MAENVAKSSDVPSKTSPVINLGDAGHTMSDSSSDSEIKKSLKEVHKFTKRVRKVVVEKRAMTSSDDSDKENPKKITKVQESESEPNKSQDEGDMSPLYQNQQGHPDFPFNFDGDNSSDNGIFCS